MGVSPNHLKLDHFGIETHGFGDTLTWELKQEQGIKVNILSMNIVGKCLG